MLVKKTKKETVEYLEFFFEDDIMLHRFMDYFDGFSLEVDSNVYKNMKAKEMIVAGVPNMEIAEKLDMRYRAVWNIKDRFLKRNLHKHNDDKEF